jgi:hypothetical protein
MFVQHKHGTTNTVHTRFILTLGNGSSDAHTAHIFQHALNHAAFGRLRYPRCSNPLERHVCNRIAAHNTAAAHSETPNEAVHNAAQYATLQPPRTQCSGVYCCSPPQCTQKYTAAANRTACKITAASLQHTPSMLQPVPIPEIPSQVHLHP